MIFRKIEIKNAGGYYKLNVTVIFFESFPDWPDLKWVCPQTHCGSSNRFVKSTNTPTPLTQWVTLKVRLNFGKNRRFPHSNNVETRFSSRYTRINRNPSEFDYFSSCLQQMNDHYIKNVFSMKIIMFQCHNHGVVYHNEAMIDFTWNFPRFIDTHKNHNSSIQRSCVGWEVVENLLMDNSIPPIFFLSSRFREIQLAIKFKWKCRFH